MKLPDCTIVIPVRNKAEELRVSVNYYLDQGLGDVPFIVIDDASDNPADIRQAVQGLSNCHLVRQKQRTGQAGARNVGLRMAKTRFCLLMDDDSHIDNPEALESFLLKPPRMSDTAVWSFAVIRQKDGMRDGIPEGLPSMRMYKFPGCGVLFHREKILQVGGFRDFWVYRGEERDLAIRLFRADLDIVYSPGIRIIHRYQPSRRGQSHVSEYEYLNVRNTLLFYFLNYPMPLGLFEGAVRALKAVIVAPRNRWDRIRGLWRGCVDCFHYADRRTPLSYQQLHRYKAFCQSVQRKLEAWGS
jgi:glycosyltransferase involved in cell wall biosynthesis